MDLIVGMVIGYTFVIYALLGVPNDVRFYKDGRKDARSWRE